MRSYLRLAVRFLPSFVRSHRDTHTYPSAGLPPGVLIDKVTLVFHWQGGAIRPLFVGTGAQAGVVREGPAYVRGGTYGDDRWELTSNPASGQPWTLDELNRVTGLLEFGFEVDAQDTSTPQVAQAYVEVAYHVPTTTYIGGLYEKTDTGGVTKYYGGVAMRQVPAGGGAGTLLYLLKDHLGSAVGVMDAFGNVLATQKYWPYGATRSGGVTQTDKLYTGQQIEYGDSALGLYNYKARFYSTVTGRFVSADSVTPTRNPVGLNRFHYAADNPATLVDPTGHCFEWAGQMLRCSGDDAQRWLDCALGGCTGDLERMALWALQRDDFWHSITKLIFGYGDVAQSLLYTIVSRPVTFARLELIPAKGWKAFGDRFKVSAAFMEYSLFDLANGTTRVDDLPFNDIIGARPWWDDAFSAGWMGRMTRATNSWGGADFWLDAWREEHELRTLSIDAAQVYNDDSLPWSTWQRSFLSQLDGSTIQPIGPDPYDTLFDKISECLIRGCDFENPGIGP